MIKLILAGIVITIISFCVTLILSDDTTQDEKTLKRSIFVGSFITFIFFCLTTSEMYSFHRAEVSHLPEENQILSSNDNMDYVYKAARSNFLFPYSDVHVIKDEKDIKPLNGNDAVIGIDVKKDNDKKAIVDIIYLTQTSCKKNTCHYEWHKNMALIPHDDIHPLKHNIFLTPYVYGDFNSYILSNAHSETAPIDIDKDIKDLKELIK